MPSRSTEPSGSEMPSESSESSLEAKTVGHTNNDNDNSISAIPSPNSNRAKFDFCYLISLDDDIREERESEFQDGINKDQNVPSDY